MSYAHELKCWPKPFVAMADGRKRFEYRNDDRNYQVGDILWVREWNPESEAYTGREKHYRVLYKLAGQFGVPEGFCVLSIEEVQPEEA